MAEAAVEQLRQTHFIEHDRYTVAPLVEAVPDMASDELVRRRAAKFIGACLLENEVAVASSESVQITRPIESLYDALQLASEGHQEAYRMIETNVRTDVVERTIKAGHVIKVDLMIDEAGKIQQHGQSMETVQANSLRFASNSWQMRERTEAETTNAFRIEQLHRHGELQDYSFVVFSMAADNMTEAEMQKVGFFTDTMSCAIQVTTANGSRLSTESAFVAGIKEPGGVRHDAGAIITLAARFGVDLAGKTAAEIINTPLKIHNSLLPNGVVDLVKLYDECVGDSFFGEAHPKQDYAEYVRKCQERERMLQPKVDAITRELIAKLPYIHNRIQAAQALDRISQKHMVEQAVFDHSINPKVFGPAAEHIVLARQYFETGNIEQGIAETNQAKATAQSNSCPAALIDGTEQKGSGAESNGSGSSDDEDCEFVSKKCPKCGEKNVLTKVTKHSISGSCGCSVKK